MYKKTSYFSQLLTGDLKGLDYSKTKVENVPKATYNFCCTIDANEMKKEVSLVPKDRVPIKRPPPKIQEVPKKPETFWVNETVQKCVQTHGQYL